MNPVCVPNSEADGDDSPGVSDVLLEQDQDRTAQSGKVQGAALVSGQ